MSWRRVAPIGDGYYWFRADPDEEPIVLRLERGLWYWPGVDKGDDDTELEGEWWSVRLEPPLGP